MGSTASTQTAASQPVGATTDLTQIATNLTNILQQINGGKPITITSQNTNAIASLADRLSISEQALSNFKLNMTQIDMNINNLNARIDNTISKINSLLANLVNPDELQKTTNDVAKQSDFITSKLTAQKKFCYYLYEDRFEVTRPLALLGDVAPSVYTASWSWTYYLKYPDTSAKPLPFKGGTSANPNLAYASGTTLTLDASDNNYHFILEIDCILLPGAELAPNFKYGIEIPGFYKTGIVYTGAQSLRFDFDVQKEQRLDLKIQVLLNTFGGIIKFGTRITAIGIK